MTGSMYAAIAGLQTHMQKMSVIGNNIANANTYGFKPGVTMFTESMYTSLSASTAGGNQFGGTNAAQVGYGSQIGSIDLVMSTGTPAPTGTNSDLYLNGNGFFLVGPKPGEAGVVADPNDLTLKRVGDFGLDKDGYLVDSNGYCVYGFMPTGDENGLMDTDDDGNVIWNTALQPIRIPVAAPAPADPNAAGAIAEGTAIYPALEEDDGAVSGTYPDTITDTEKRVNLQGINLSFDNNGVITGTTQDGKVVTVGVIAIGSVINPNGLTKLSEGYYQAGNNAGDITVGTCSNTVTGYLNNAENATGGDQALTGTGTTTILAGYLESSKTDISTEFSDLITTQRGFQANTKIITVTDEMLSELVSMKR